MGKEANQDDYKIKVQSPVQGFPELVGWFFFADILLSILETTKSILVAELSSMSFANWVWKPFTQNTLVTTCFKEPHNLTQRCMKSITVFHILQTLLMHCWTRLFPHQKPFFRALLVYKVIKTNQVCSDQFAKQTPVI